MYYENAVKNIRSELKSYIVNNNIKSLVLGVSGGIDSALCAMLAKPVCDELQIPLIGASITIESNKADEIDRAKRTGKLFCTEFYDMNLTYLYEPIRVDLNPIYLKDEDETAWKIRNGNMKARLRMIFLYNLASEHNGLVLSTDNLTEYLLGFWTLHGDVGDYGMIQELWKTDIYDMAQWLANNEYVNNKDLQKLIEDTINCNATDGLGITNTDLDQILPDWIGNSRNGYAKVDQILARYQESGFGDKTDPVIRRHLNSKFKRNNPTNIPLNKITKTK